MSNCGFSNCRSRLAIAGCVTPASQAIDAGVDATPYTVQVVLPKPIHCALRNPNEPGHRGIGYGNPPAI